MIRRVWRQTADELGKREGCVGGRQVGCGREAAIARRQAVLEPGCGCAPVRTDRAVEGGAGGVDTGGCERRCRRSRGTGGESQIRTQDSADTVAGDDWEM